jgi:DNA-binding MarR family transcriptional regulator
LLAKVLLAFALEFEAQAKISLAIAANVLRVLEDEPIPVRNLPQLSGVSKEALAMATGWLQKYELVVLAADRVKGKGKAIALTAKGRIARQACHQLAWAIENRWTERFGQDHIQRLRAALERLLAASDENGSLIMQCVRPYPDDWRASLPAPQTLPHFPMILHRGGFPDGS